MREATLYVEGSFSQETGAAGWGSVQLLPGGTTFHNGGILFGIEQSTAAELAAVERAIAKLTVEVDVVTLCMRSTAALSVLRWVFDLPCEGVPAPKRLVPHLKRFTPLYDLHDTVERTGVRIILRHVARNDWTDGAMKMARTAMLKARAA